MVPLPITLWRRRHGDLRQLGGLAAEGFGGDPRARGDDPTQVLALGRHDLPGHRGAEIDDDTRSAVLGVGGDRVAEAIGAEFLGRLDPERHPGPDPRLDEEGGLAEISPHPFSKPRIHGRHHRRHRHTDEIVRCDTLPLQELPQPHADLIGGSVGLGGQAPVPRNSSPRNSPTTVLVLPTSRASSRSLRPTPLANAPNRWAALQCFGPAQLITTDGHSI